MALKRDLPEGGTIPAMDPVLDALVASERGEADALLARLPGSRAARDLAAEADRLHRDPTVASDLAFQAH